MKYTNLIKKVFLLQNDYTRIIWTFPHIVESIQQITIVDGKIIQFLF